MTQPELKQIGRIAFREEGTMWNAYYALTDTMEGALWLGSIALVAVERNKKAKQTFIDLMRALVADILEEKTGARPTWKDPVKAPEHERTKS